MFKKTKRVWLKAATMLAVGGSLFQAATCDTTTRSLSQDLVITIVDQWITDYVNDQFRVSGNSGF